MRSRMAASSRWNSARVMYSGLECLEPKNFFAATATTPAMPAMAAQVWVADEEEGVSISIQFSVFSFRFSVFGKGSEARKSEQSRAPGGVNVGVSCQMLHGFAKVFNHLVDDLFVSDW